VNAHTYASLLDLFAGIALITAVMTLWRRRLVAIVRLLAVQGAAVAATALLIGIDRASVDEIVLATVALVLKAFVIPFVLLRVVRRGPDTRETEPLVNVSASLVAAAVLITLAFAATRAVVALSPGPEAAVIPLGFAIVLIGFFALATRRKALSQLVGFFVFENGVALVAVLAAAGVSFVVELGVALDVLLAVLVLQVLAARMQDKFGTLDLDHLRELRD
jgi:hydrogenase-4 component E